jgi:hypothetical protein
MFATNDANGKTVRRADAASLFDRKLAVNQLQLARRNKRSPAAVVREVGQAVIKGDVAVVFPLRPLRKARARREHRERDQSDIHRFEDGHIATVFMNERTGGKAICKCVYVVALSD